MKKSDQGKDWKNLEATVVSNAEPAPKEEEGMNGNIMGMMKKMYNEGDDEMKKTIGEAWTKSQAGQAGMRQ